MNDLFVFLGIESWKGAFGSLLLPPLPFLFLILAGARLMYRRRLLAWSLLLSGVVGIWLSCTTAVGTAMTNVLLMPPHALSPSDIGELKKAPKTAIVVLGAGRILLAPEYGISSLKPFTMERLRYGLWLSRETSLPVAFSGGLGYGADPGPTESEVAARVAERDFGRPLRWMESLSRDTNENAYRSLAMLGEQGIEHIVLVTHGFHMRRALAAFERAKQRSGIAMQVTAAPMGLQAAGPLRLSDWFPSEAGYQSVRIALHEWIGRLAGA